MEGLTLFRSVLTVLIVLVIAYWCSRVLARQWMKSSGSANLQIIEQLQVGQNQRILLLKTGGSHYLIGVSQAGIQCLAEVKGDFETEPLPPAQEGPAQFPFQEIMEKYLTGHSKKKGGDQ